jgi:uroporphyrin-III C-methyltransferase
VTGKVYLVGAGPGGIDLLTVKAARLIGQADVLLYDALVTPDIVELAQSARKICVGKRGGRASTDQAFINRLLVASARDGSVVVRLKGGDPMIFGRAQEEIEACRAANIEVEVVAGVTAASAAAAQLGISLTQRGIARSLAFVTPTHGLGTLDDDSWADGLIATQSIAIYMGKGQSTRVRHVLLARGFGDAMPVVLVYDVGRDKAGHIAGTLANLGELVNLPTNGPIMILVGEVFKGIAAADAKTILSRATAAPKRRAL